ncbi:hypothetical protein WICMUC_002488 [Wickerhamomyces mucosus]|uniref:Uncharacterized protein n=1 Tax=Wickerhamomyces mucosus TaxID=1378264 RepID=A0A9P8PPE7_9ASCO|nr:hypothetical protein WICMUC_002488 [Wickerhamomyces mucosus]
MLNGRAMIEDFDNLKTALVEIIPEGYIQGKFQILEIKEEVQRFVSRIIGDHYTNMSSDGLRDLLNSAGSDKKGLS